MTVEGSITQDGEHIIYVFGANAGQQMSLVVTTPPPDGPPPGFVAVLVITFADGTVEGPLTNYNGEIPATGDNYIDVSANLMISDPLTGSFTLTLEIT